MRKACIFVDGENFRFSLSQLFPNDRFHFHRQRYLPRTDWHGFFGGVAQQFGCELLTRMQIRARAAPSDSEETA